MDSALDRQREAAASPGSPLAITLWVSFWTLVVAGFGVFAGVMYASGNKLNALGYGVFSTVVGAVFGAVAWVVLWRVYGGEYAMRRWRLRERNRRERVEQKHSSCPSCGAMDGGELVSRKRVETGEIGYVTLHKPMPVTDSLGKVTHHVHVPVQEPYRKAVLRVKYRCRHCSHAWAHDEAQLPFL
jgi:hypothetical protein